MPAPNIIFVGLKHCGRDFLVTLNPDRTVWFMYHPNDIDSGPFYQVAASRPICPICHSDINEVISPVVISEEGEILRLSNEPNPLIVSHLN